MDDVVEISGLENACRLCLTTEQTRSSIFGVPHVSVPFVEKIRACLSIQISSHDKLSTLVCTNCIKNINQWYSYKDICLQSQEKLQQWFAKQSTTVQPVVTVKEEPVDVEFPDDNPHITNANHHAVLNDKNMDVDSESNIIPIINKIIQGSPDEILKMNEKIDKDHTVMIQIKSEPVDTEDEDDCNVDVESVNSGELLINPMAVVANTGNNDRIMEADSTQKFSTRRFGTKKRMRRGPHTHYRGIRLFKKKCVHCKIYLHSKYSYTQHMSRYHGIVNNLSVDFMKPPNQPSMKKQKSKLSFHTENTEPITDTQNEINSEDLEFEKMIKTDPLIPVQKTIISQLKTFSCYSCKQTFFDRRHTLNHIRQHMPDLRPFTCIACLTEFSDRSMYKLHCGASFECAMKIALVVPKVGNEKYFTCNMCLRPFDNRKELLTHLAIHADKQYQQLAQPLRSPPKLKPINPSPPTPKIDSSPIKKPIVNVSGPYMNGDPAHNHMCDLCGMIYRYKPNMFKHRELCSTLPENIRTSYRCIHCNMTYLVYKKFYTHVLHDHKKREITCFTCHEKFTTPDDYLSHHETHRVRLDKENVKETSNEQQPNNEFSITVNPLNSVIHPMDVNDKPFNCALCGEDFATKIELTEHRNLHLKVKIYSCVICRSMFSSSGALEVHMKDHGIEDPGEQNANSSCVEYGRQSRSQTAMNDSSTSDPGGCFHHCYECNKNFSNLANLKRHERNLHSKQRRRWSCDDCKRRFKSVEAYNEHVRTEHGSTQQQQHLEKPPPPPPPQLSSSTGKPLMQCPKCPKTFAYQGNLIIHCQNVHKENHFERARANAARPTAPSSRHTSTISSWGHSCDLCGKTFREEQSLKTHRGWHLRSTYRLKVDKNASLDETTLSGPGYTMTMTSSSKPAKARKSFPNNPTQKQLGTIANLQCQVCDDRFTDVAELRKHLWDVHCARNKPEKSFTSELQCELCTNKFPDEESLENHMKWHSQNPILSGNNASGTTSSFEAPTKTFYCDICGKYYSNRKLYLRHKKLHKVLPATTMMNLQSLQTKRPYCHSCQKSFSTDASLKRHKASPCHHSVVRIQNQHGSKKITTTALVHQPPSEPMRLQAVKREPGLEYASASQLGGHGSKRKPVTCLICKTMFPNMSVLYQHKQLVHKLPTSGRDRANSQQQAECVPLVSAEGLVCCNLCGKQFPGVPNLKQHFAHKHKTKSATFPCRSLGCKLVFSSAHSLKSHETTHSSMIYNCHLCDGHVFSRAAMTKHMMTMHKAIYQSGASKSSLWSETDLTTYNVKNCQSTACPKCKIKYPNLRALKIHYLKFHEKS
ncbi:PREDICTED: zinc finger protein 62 homolog isoform X2 [Ceratosolen solmsi marchali]|uniref:Zinc finger protein 62 homolog isoform X2 n=1 Tax=Ceratosolen solmsi marchali TaxID=326594 RepID=A0AAJ7E055_9HYME|nr:PREDICTED: zinc finger protein 62 homolog isoform X2 [Ceratosolen solmsi marchali]